MSASARSMSIRRRSPRASGFRGRAGAREPQLAEFSTTVAGLLTLSDCLAAFGVTQVVMEATGVFWQPVVRHEALLDRVG